MRIQLTVLLLAAIGPNVYINAHDESSILLGPGKPMASAIFDKIGVRVNWRAGELGTARTGAGRVDASRLASGIRTVERAPDSAPTGALASAHLLGNSEVHHLQGPRRKSRPVTFWPTSWRMRCKGSPGTPIPAS